MSKQQKDPENSSKAGPADQKGRTNLNDVLDRMRAAAIKVELNPSESSGGFTIIGYPTKSNDEDEKDQDSVE